MGFLGEKKKTILVFFSFFLLLLFLNSKIIPGGNNIPVVFLLLNVFTVKKIRKKAGILERLFILYFAYLAIISLLHIKTNFNISNSIFYFIECAIIYISFKISIENIDLEKLLVLFRNFGLVLSVLAIIESIIQNPILCKLLAKSYMIDPTGYRINLLFGHPIICGVFLLFSWCALVGLPFKRNIINVISHVLLLTAIMVSRSRSTWLALVVIIALIGVKYINNNRKYIKRSIVIRMGIAAGCLIVLDGVSGFFISSYIFKYISSRIIGSLYAGEGQGNIIRVDTMLNSIRYWRNGNLDKFIFGMGKNWDKYFMTLFPVVKFGKEWTAAIDNQYFTTIHEAGIIGLVIWLSFISFSLLRSLKNKRNTGVSVVANYGLVSVFVTIFFYEGFNYMNILSLIMLLLLISDKYSKYEEVKND